MQGAEARGAAVSSIRSMREERAEGNRIPVFGLLRSAWRQLRDMIRGKPKARMFEPLCKPWPTEPVCLRMRGHKGEHTSSPSLADALDDIERGNPVRGINVPKRRRP